MWRIISRFGQIRSSGSDSRASSLSTMDYKKEASVETGYYLERRFRDPYDKERGAQPFYLKSIHNFYKKFGSSWDAESAMFLEYGGGPVIYPLISAAPFFSEITFSDYQQHNLDAVIAWKNCREGHHDWTPYFEYIISQLEGNEGEEAVSQRQKELRSKCQHFFRGDFNANDIILSDAEDFRSKFDVVSSNFAADAVAQDLKGYHKNVQHLGELVKPGGFITSLVSLEESYCYTSYSDQRMFHLYLTKGDVKEVYAEAGFDIVYENHHLLPESARNILNDCKSLLFIAGKKKN